MEKTYFPPPHLSQKGYSNVYVLHMAHIAMVCHLSCDAMCEVLIWKIMINSCMQCIVVVCQCVACLLDISSLEVAKIHS
jgi:hypothetical protein